MTDSSSNDPALVLLAAQFAATKHRDQRRKDRGASPYINHPIAVATMLATVGGVTDARTLAAALLHDTIEDTQTTPDELGSAFGPYVLALVEELTDDKSLPKAERKRLQILRAPHASRAAKEIKLADKICNVADIADSPPKGWSLERRRKYLDWTEQVVAGCRGANPALEEHYDEVLAGARLALALDQRTASSE